MVSFVECECQGLVSVHARPESKRAIAAVRLIHDLGTPQRGLIVKSLSVAGTRFANWRWQTLHEVTVSLLRMQEAVCSVARIPDGSALFSSRDGDAHKLCGIVTSSAFWDQTRALAAVIRILTSFSSWVRGCQCHEGESHRGKHILCPLKGCRARELADKLASVAVSMAEQRASCPDFGSVPRHVVALALTMAMSDLHTKFHWVTSCPI